jgi:Ca2+-binding EF-hand superfamily protein
MIEEFDLDMDGEISESEFIKYVHSLPLAPRPAMQHSQ